MATIVAQNIVDAGTEPTFSSSNLVDSYPIGTGHNSFACFKSTDGTNIKTLTITSNFVMDNGDLGPNHVVSLPVNGVVKIPMRKSYDDGTGHATVTISGTGGAALVTSYCAVVG